MSKLRERPAPGQVERELKEALQRLVDGEPTSPELMRKARRGTLKINVSALAKEARRSRTLISHDRCAYPQVRAAVLSHAKPAVEPTSMAEVNRHLRMEVAELRRTVKLERETKAAMIRRMDRVVQEARRKITAAERRDLHDHADPSEIAGTQGGRMVAAKLLMSLPTKS